MRVIKGVSIVPNPKVLPDLAATPCAACQSYRVFKDAASDSYKMSCAKRNIPLVGKPMDTGCPDWKMTNSGPPAIPCHAGQHCVHKTVVRILPADRFYDPNCKLMCDFQKREIPFNHSGCGMYREIV